MSKKMRVGILFGGRSGEHQVSVTNALSLMQSLDYSALEVMPLYMTQQGVWQLGDWQTAPVQDKLSLTARVSAAPAAVAGFDNGLARVVEALSKMDAAVPLMQGGAVQGLLELVNIPYIGAGVLFSAVGMDKVIMKRLLAQAGIPQSVYRYFSSLDWRISRDEQLLEIEVAVGYPCYVKPAMLGSGCNLAKVVNQAELIAAVEDVFRFDRKVIVEEAVDAHEVAVGIVGNELPRASVCGDIRGKVTTGLPSSLAERLQALAVHAFKAVHGSGLAQVNFYIRSENQAVMVSELMTMPGIAPLDTYPQLWEQTGLPYHDLLNELIILAMERCKAHS